MTSPNNASPRGAQRTASVHAGGVCELRCVLCDCTDGATRPEQVDRALHGGGARVLIRGATENSAATAGLVEQARGAGFSEVVLRTNAVGSRLPAKAAAFARLGADAALVPLFSHNPAVHDRIAGRSGALRDALTGMQQLARAGLAIEIEVPILPLRLQKLDSLVQLAQRAVPALRAARFYLPSPTPKVLAPSPWDIAGPALAQALLRCRELGIKTRLSTQDGVPLCALRDSPDLYDAYGFNPKTRATRRADAVFAAPCQSCAVREQCAGLLPSYVEALGDAGIAAYAQRPPLMYEQRTTRRRVWTAEQQRAAARAEILVLRPTVNCNQDCTFCSANETSANVWADHREMLQAIARAGRRGIERVSFSGGEPTLSKHLVEYVRNAARLGIPKIEIISNAVLLDKKEKVAALAEAGLTHAFISLHAHDEELAQRMTQKVGDFARTVQGIRNLVAAGIRTSTNHVITAQNYMFLTRYVEFMREQFGGKVNISFAFVTPQFKALDNMEVMPRLSDVMPHLKRAMYRALEIGQPFGIGSRQGIPFCFLDEFRAWSDGIKLSNSAISEDAPQKQRSAVCDDCRFSNYCTGLWRPYVAKYGLGELHAVPGEKLTAADAQQIQESTRVFDWGEPRSFAEVPELLRQRELENGAPELTAPTPFAGPFVAQRSRPLRIALLGSGRQARRLARNAREVAGLSIDAVASPHAPQADLTDFGGCPAYSDAATAIDDIRPEAIIIAAATPAHYDLARLALDRGIPALLEKPIAGSEEQALALRDAALAVGGCIVPAHNSACADGLDEILALRFAQPAASYIWRRTARSSDVMRTWNRAALYELVYHLLVVLRRATRGNAGEVVKTSWRGDAAPQFIRLDLQFASATAELIVDCAAPVEEDVLALRESGVPDSEWVWRRQGRNTSLQNASGVRMVERRGNDVQHMLAAFRDVVLGTGEPHATLDEAIDVMHTARKVVEALDAAGAPFDRVTAPRHVSSAALQQALR